MGRNGFGGLLSDEQWARLLRSGHTRYFQSGEPIVRQGEYEDTVYLLVEGTIKVTMVRPDGTGLLLALRGPGESIGEMSAMSGLPRSATVTPSAGKCLTSVLGSAQFRLLIAGMEAEQALWKHLVRRQTESDSLRAEMAALPARQRLAATLLRLAQLMGNPHAHGRDGFITLRLGLSQRELGDSVGLSRAVVSAEYHRLRKLGVVRTGREYVAIRDLERLRAVAEGEE